MGPYIDRLLLLFFCFLLTFVHVIGAASADCDPLSSDDSEIIEHFEKMFFSGSADTVVKWKKFPSISFIVKEIDDKISDDINRIVRLSVSISGQSIKARQGSANILVVVGSNYLDFVIKKHPRISLYFIDPENHSQYRSRDLVEARLREAIGENSNFFMKVNSTDNAVDTVFILLNPHEENFALLLTKSLIKSYYPSISWFSSIGEHADAPISVCDFMAIAIFSSHEIMPGMPKSKAIEIASGLLTSDRQRFLNRLKRKNRGL